VKHPKALRHGSAESSESSGEVGVHSAPSGLVMAIILSIDHDLASFDRLNSQGDRQALNHGIGPQRAFDQRRSLGPPESAPGARR
jgi:hypothetical protein